MRHNSFQEGPAIYEITIKGHLDERWARWFGDMTVTTLPGGITRLCGPVADQPALHGILSRIRDLGLVLISIERQGARGVLDDPPALPKV